MSPFPRDRREETVREPNFPAHYLLNNTERQQVQKWDSAICTFSHWESSLSRDVLQCLGKIDVHGLSSETLGKLWIPDLGVYSPE